MSNFVKPIGNPLNPRIMVLGEAPGGKENLQGEPFVGASGELLDDVFKDCGHPDWRTKFWISNVYKYQPPWNIIKRIGEVCNPAEQLALLDKEIQEVNPHIILALGKTALEATTGYEKILRYRGSILPHKEWGIPKVVASIHPANIIRNTDEESDNPRGIKPFPYIWKRVLQSDIEKAWTESANRDFNFTPRNLKVARSFDDVFSFLHANRHKPYFYADVETYKCTLPVCVGIGFDQYEALSIPLFNKLERIELCTIPSRELAMIWDLLDELFRTKLVAGQNWKFDQGKLETLGFTFKGLYSDISLKAHTVNPELPLFRMEFLQSLFSREPYHKDEGKEFQWGRDNIDKLFLYNAKDVVVTAEIDEVLEEQLVSLSEQYKTDLKGFYYNYVTKLHQFYFEMEKVGFNVDEDQRQFLCDKYTTWSDILIVKLESRIGRSINWNSPQQKAEVLYDQMRIPEYKMDKRGTGEDTLSRLLKYQVKDPLKREIITDMLTLVRVRKTLSTYLYADTDYDGKMRTQFRVAGTETGRSSTGKIDIPTRPFECGWAFQTLTKHGTIGQDIRSYIVPPKDWVFVSIDKAQAEARVVCVLAEDWEGLEAMDKLDIHRRMAACALITGRLNLNPEFDPIADTLDKNGAERLIGKKSKHATNYDMGWFEFQSNVITDARRMGIDINISKWRAEQILQRIHDANPKTRGIFQAQVREHLETKRVLITPQGRMRRFYERVNKQFYGEGYAYIPQATVIDNVRESGLDIRDCKYPIRICGEAHDNLLYLMPKSEYIDICKEIKSKFERPIDFSGCSLSRNYKLIIPVDFEVGLDNYKDLKSLKVA